MRKRIHFYFSWRNVLITFGFLAVASGICFLFQELDDQSDQLGRNNVYVLLIFVLAVILISRFTQGYFYGALSAVFAVFAVNFAFTYPYFVFDFSPAGYPLTFLTVVVCVIISILASNIKNRANIEVEIEKEKNRANLLRAISHDIRTPLTSIMGSASAILDNNDKLSERAKQELVTDIHEQAVWLIRVVENLLSITRINDSPATLEKRDEMVEEIVGEVMEKFKKQYPEVMLRVNVPANLLFVPMDAMLIEQVMMNILENAVRHGGCNAISIQVKAEKKKAVFEFADNGTGIKKELLANLFSNYFVADKENKQDHKRNMGIGLSVCMTIIKAHGGGMKAYNSQKGGAVFEFWLPMELQEVVNEA